MTLIIPPTGLTELLLSDSPSEPTMVDGVKVSASIELQSTSKALLLSRMTTSQINDIPVPVNGMITYNETTHAVNTYANDSWSAAGGGSVTSVSVESISDGITVGGGPITTAGTLTFELSTNLQSLSDLISTGIMIKTGGSTYDTRSIAVASSSRLTILNANGVAANPTLDLATTAISAGTFTYPSSITFDAYGRATAATSGTTPVLSVSGTVGNISSTGGQNPILNLVTTGITAQHHTVPNLTVDIYGRITEIESATRILDNGLIVGNFFAGSNAGNLTLTSAEGNTSTGVNSLHAISTGIQNSFFGNEAGIVINTGRFNSGLGQRVLASITNNDANSGFGFNAASSLNTGSGILALGANAMAATTSALNVIAIGRDTVVTDGISNSAVLGYAATISVSNAMNFGSECFVGINNPSPAYNLDIKNIISGSYVNGLSAFRMETGLDVPSSTDNGYITWVYTVQSTNTDDITLPILVIGTNKSATIDVTINGATSTFSDFTGGRATAGVIRGAGSISLIGSSYSKILSTTGDFSIDVSGADTVVLHATGIAASTYNWQIVVRCQIQ